MIPATEDEVHAEAKRRFPSFPIGWNPLSAMTVLASIRAELELQRKKPN